MEPSINFLVGGEAGQGVQTVGFLLAKALAKYGYHVFADQDYESRVRGGHNFFRVRASRAPVYAIKEQVDVLLALNRETVEIHRSELSSTGVMVYDAAILDIPKISNIYAVPVSQISQNATGNTQSANMVLLTAALALGSYDIAALQEMLRQYFGGDAGEKNARAAAAAHQFVKEHPLSSISLKLELLGGAPRLLLTGNEAMALGALAAGCRFVAAYPMTPITPIIEYLAGKGVDFGLVMVPAEDEIAAINMAIGAGYAGVRAMTATSGGGFCLMVEGLGLAGMTETPVVIIEGQRPGPAIGLPTRQEQGDLDFVLHASHGEFPRVVLTPATIEESFWAVVKAFNLAEKYQLPVIVMTDHHLATSYGTIEKIDLAKVEIDRGSLAHAFDGEYKRHLFTDSGISPRAFPGKSATLVVTDSDEHDETGHLTEDPALRTRMMNKRMGKLELVKHDIASPRLEGAANPEIILVSWGSTYGAVREATQELLQAGLKIAHLNLSEIFPFPSVEVKTALGSCQKVIVIEGNATGQMAKLLQRETCLPVNGLVLRYDGRPFIPAEIAAAVRKEVE